MATGGGTAPKKRGPVKAVPDKPQMRTATFDADAAEREDVQATPFVLRLAGQEFVLADALEVDARTMNDAGYDSYAFLRGVSPDDETRPAYEAAIGGSPVWLVRDIAQAYFEHYGMPTESGEGTASPA